MKVTRGKHGSIDIQDNDYHIVGEYSMSPKGRYTIAWFDGHITVGGNLQNGLRHHSPGKFLLLERDKQVLQGSKQRPNNGHVADNGTFVLCDWTFQRNSGVFSAADRSGKILLERQLGKMSSCGISPDGRYACCQTVHSDREDANRLHFFDLNSGELLWAKEPETGTGARSYRFDTARGLLYLEYSEWGPLAYSFAGEFLDAQTWQQRRIEREQAIAFSDAVEANGISEIIEPAYIPNGSIKINGVHEPGPGRDVQIIEANEPIATYEPVESTEINRFVEPIENIEHIYVADEGIRLLKGISDIAARRSRGQVIFASLRQAWLNTPDSIVRARICQSLGELFEVLDLPDKAIQSYEQGLFCDETMDVRRRVASLKRKVSQTAV